MRAFPAPRLFFTPKPVGLQRRRIDRDLHSNITGNQFEALDLGVAKRPSRAGVPEIVLVEFELELARRMIIPFGDVRRELEAISFTES